MARQGHLAEAEFRLRILRRYGILVAFDGPAPAKLPSVARDDAKETFKSWKARVFPGVERLRVYLAAEPAPQARLHKMVEQGPRSELRGLLIQHSRAATDTRTSKAQKAELRAKRLVGEALRRTELVDAAAASQLRRERSSGLDRLASDLDAWLDRATGLDPLVAVKAKELQQRLAAGESVSQVIADLILYASECRTLVSRSIPKGPQS